MTKKQKTEQAAKERAYLKSIIQEDDTVFTVFRHVSKTGMYRCVDLYLFKPVTRYKSNANGCYWAVEKTRITHSVATALGLGYNQKHESIGVRGCGFDAGAEVVSLLSAELFSRADALRKEEI